MTSFRLGCTDPNGCPVRSLLPESDIPCEPRSEDWQTLRATATPGQLSDVGMCMQNRKNHDDLTSLLTDAEMRRRIDAKLESIVHPRERSGLAAFIDGENFGKINHEYGQDACDMAIRALASRVRGCIRTDDLIAPEDGSARRGGDEMVLFIPGMTLVAAYKRMTQIRENIGNPSPITFGSGTFDWRADVVGVYLHPESAVDVVAGLQVASVALGAWKETDRSVPPPLLLQASGEPYDPSQFSS